MRKNFGAKTAVYPMPVFIIATYGKADPEKIRPITYDGITHGYYVLGERVGNAFSDGKKL